MGKAVAFGILIVLAIALVAVVLFYLTTATRDRRRKRALRRPQWEVRTQLEADPGGTVLAFVSIELVAKWGAHREVLASHGIATVPMADDMALAEAQDTAKRMAVRSNLAGATNPRTSQGN